MHLLPRDTTDLDDGKEAVDLGQSPGDLVVLSFTDSDLATVAAAVALELGRFPSVRIASLARLQHPFSVDRYVETIIAKAKTVVIRLLGGLDYWRYGAEQAHAAALQHGVRLAIVPGDSLPDPRLAGVSTLPPDDLDAIWRCFAAGGAQNVARALSQAVGDSLAPPLPDVLPRFGIERDFSIGEGQPRAAIVCYRALKIAGDLAPLCALEGALAKRGFTTRMLFVATTKETDCADFLQRELAAFAPHVVINTTAFSARREDGTSPFDAAGAPVLQAIIANGEAAAWHASSRGLGATDLAMNVVMPELDGRLMGRAIAFREQGAAVPDLEFAPRRVAPLADRVAFVADQAAALARLATLPNGEKTLALILNDYPGAAGRAGHAVGLDGPASALAIIEGLQAEGYKVEPPKLGEDDQGDTAFMQGLASAERAAVMPIEAFRRRFGMLSGTARDALLAAHGPIESDPDFAAGAFRFRVLMAGRMVVALQPPRGRAATHRADFHDMTQPPRHGFLAFYWWLRDVFGADALIHLGAHGSLEWLPGKAAALAAECWPEVALGGVPVIYPFIVSDPGEAAQAKRRLSALTIGHLTPPLVEAGLAGEAAAIEPLLEEYASAQSIDPERARLLANAILEQAESCGLLTDLGVVGSDPLAALDAWLCDLKEMRIKDGLHVFGRSSGPRHDLRADMDLADPADVEERVARCGLAEMAALLAALGGRFVLPGPAGSPARGRLDCLPTGRNLTTLDPRQSPTRTAELIGRRAADVILTRYVQDNGEYPRALVIDAWGSAAIRTGGDELAQALALMGVRLVRETTSDRVTGIELMSLAELGRPRIDVTLKISGLYRDLFPQQLVLFDQAVRLIADRDEPAEDNPLRAAAAGLSGDARALALLRIFGPAPSAYGTGLEPLVLADETRDALGDAYLAAGAHAYGRADEPIDRRDLFERRIAGADAHLRSHDLPEQDLLDAPDYAYASGGFLAAAKRLGGTSTSYHLDTTRLTGLTIRPLGQEIARLVGGRMTHPRWIAGQRRHGWRGAAELAQSVDSLYAFAATTDLVAEHHFDRVFRAYLDDPEVDAFLRRANPEAHGAIEARLAQAIMRGLWQPRRNSVLERLGPRMALPRAAE